ncbi:midasin-like [Liolophura sinensis]|uniref:midasin-like n=1 Tax=Liolophura sinensis TaxID=3198878 RepID=UPI0031580D65
MYSVRCFTSQPTVPTPQDCLLRLTQCLPLLQQYSTLVEFYLAQVISTHRVTGKLLSVLLKVFTELAVKGFCLPAEFAGEMDGSGATEFEDIEGGGLGEGEGTKDVSDQIENEDQLHEAQKAGEKKEEELSDQPDVPSEDNAIEMSDDFEGKMHDLDPADGEEDEDDGNDEEEKLDKQLGDVDGEGADRLDEQMWGSDNEEEDAQDKEETGPGAGKQTESELVAKDDLPDKSEREGEREGEMEPQPEDGEAEEQKSHNLEKLDESEYDDNQVDPHNKQPPEEQPDALDLPDDLNLDEEEGQETSEDKQAVEHEISEEQNIPDVPEDTNEDEPEDSEDKAGEDKKDNPEDRDSEDATTREPEEDMDTEQSLDTQQLAEDDTPDDSETNKDGKHEEGLDPQDNLEEEVHHKDSLQSEEAEMAEMQGQTTHGVEETEQSETAKDRAGTSENNQDESDGTGQSVSQLSEGHEGQTSTQVSQGGSTQENKQKQKHKPGVSDSKRSLGSVEEKYKRLTTQDNTSEQAEENEDTQKDGADLFEHIKDTDAHSDMQTLDVATSDQQEEQPIPNKDMEEAEPMEEEAESVRPDERQEENKDQEAIKELKPGKLKPPKAEDGESKGEDSGEAQKYVSTGDRVLTMTAERGPESTIHTALEHLNIEEENVDVEKLRSELEERLPAWHQTQTLHTSNEAMEAWFRYETITSSLSQELCEQLRLVLEPTQATKLKGDYRTGKRLNMRKVIPYIASEFRKDKIWLRRTKPSKREYQILVAVDDSSSMMDNHSKQLAFESLAVISNALSLLEAGQLGICSFGESVKVLHPFTEQFTSQSGARILQQFTFEQKKTKIAQLLKEVTGVMLDARTKQLGAAGWSETAQLLLVVSDGRGLFMEGMDVVKTAVRQARAANIFLVFVIIDNPQCKDSILDIKVPHFKGSGQLPEIQSYMDHFPFPFYLILRDINSLPSTLSDALRQWFELVTASDR